MSMKTKCVVALIFLCVVDVIVPVPIVGLTLLYVVFQRPPWFLDTVREIYSTN